jgi:A/G-specific adenine glycosylase
MPPSPVTAFRRRILRWYERQGRDLPWRRTTDPYAILVSEVMLQQTQVARVIPFWEAFIRAFPTPGALARTALPDVLSAWKGLGYNTRARRLRDAAAAIVSDHAGAFPDDPAALQALPGIGRYTASAVLVFAFNRELPLVETNIRRVLITEGFAAETATPKELESVAARLIPPGRSRDWHNALMDYGATVATARATGVAPVSRQAPFHHSRRWYRGKVLGLLLSRGGEAPVAELASDLSVTPEYLVAEILPGLAADGLVAPARRGLLQLAR